MKTMRHGFTMIELIFVIVIIGILAAVAIPKLAATRDDAKITNIIANTKTLVADLQSFYTSQGKTSWNDINTKISDATNVPSSQWGDCSSPADESQPVSWGIHTFCEESGVTANPCVLVFGTQDSEFNPDTGEFKMWPAVGVWAVGGSAICDAVANDPAILSLAGEDGWGKYHRLGGSAINR